MENMNVEFKDVVRIVGEIGEETLHNFIKDTDVIMASKLQYDEDTQYLKEEFGYGEISEEEETGYEIFY